MALNPTNTVLGTCNGQNVVADLSGGLDPAAAAFVTLSATYNRTPPPGYPDTIAGWVGSVATQIGGNPRIIASGTRIQVLQPEAAALIATGGATPS